VARDDVAASFIARQMVDEALRKLDSNHRAVVALHYLVGLSVPEVAAALGIPLGTAKSRLHYALTAMRAAVNDDHDPRPAAVIGGRIA
jgi:RNA polymerase sigma-70 factor (ECF subfamily)